MTDMNNIVFAFVSFSMPFFVFILFVRFSYFIFDEFDRTNIKDIKEKNVSMKQ